MKSAPRLSVVGFVMVVVMMFASVCPTNADAALDTYLEVTPFMDVIPLSETSGGSPPVAEVTVEAKVVAYTVETPTLTEEQRVFVRANMQRSLRAL